MSESNVPRSVADPRRGLSRYMPILGSLRGYDRQNAKGDLAAGLTTAVMLIPQGMAYAMLAGLPPIYGLYASLLPLVVYALFGTSRQLAVGPVAMVSLLVAAGVSQLAPTGSSAYVTYAILLALMVGVLQLGMGLFRLGFVVNFLSHPVISGFTSAAAIIIGLSQLKEVLGFKIPRSHHVHEIILQAAAGIHQTHLITLAIALGSIAALVAMKRYAPAFPRALVVVVASTLIVWGFGLHDHGVAIVGDVPAGLPSLSLPALDWSAAKQLVGVAMAIALVGFMESIAVAKKYARDNKYDVDANKELVGLGLANVVGAFAGSYPVTGGFSRTAVNAQAGARTSLAGVVTAAIVALALIAFTPLFHFLPKAVLAAIIMTAVFGLIDVAEVKHLWKVKRRDLAMLGLTFAVTLGVGIEPGIITGVVASLALLVWSSTRPHVAVLGRLPETTAYRNVERYPDAITSPGVLVLRLDAQVYYGNVAFLKETLDQVEQRDMHCVVLDACGINQLDASGEAAFREILDGYRARGIDLYLANVKGPVRDVFARSGFAEDLGPEHFFLSVDDAVKRATGQSEAPVRGGLSDRAPEFRRAS
ncbi:MAG: solute carrier family 26 protein [Polyangiaceae bacterium]